MNPDIPAPGMPPIVFVSRHPLFDAPPGALPGFGPGYRTAVVGGSLIIREIDGSLRTLVDSSMKVNGGRLIDVSGPKVSWDGLRIVFSGIQHPDSSWRIYEIRSDGKDLRKITGTDRRLDLSQFGVAAGRFQKYDDIDPCYLPDGRIVFASTRSPAIAEIGNVLVTNLYVVNQDGSGLHRITSERNGAEEPAVDPVTGRIVFARWWVNIDRPSNTTRDGLARDDRLALTDDFANIWHAMSVNPDGSLLKLYAGFTRTRFGTQTYKPSVMSDGKLLSVFSPQTSLLPSGGGNGIRWFNAGADYEHHIVGVKSDESLRRLPQAQPPYATDPMQLTENSILVSYSADGSDYGIYSCKLNGSDARPVVDLAGTIELEPQVVQRRNLPPLLEDRYPPILSELPPTEDPETYYVNDSFRFDCMNVFMNGAVDEPMPDAPKIAAGAKIRFFLNFQRQNPASPDPSILIKTANVFPRGGVHEPGLPADVPMFEQIVDNEGKVLQTSSGGFAHVTGMNYERFGGGTKCVGCHAGHSMLTVPVNASVSEWINASPSARVNASSFFVDEIGKFFPPQRIVDRQARIGGDSVVWVANEGKHAWISLKWEIPVELREIILYGITPKDNEGTNIRVHDSKIFLYYNSNEVGLARSTGAVEPEGTRISIPVSKVDSARIVISDFTGTVRRRSVPGLAEVETVARIY